MTNQPSANTELHGAIDSREKLRKLHFINRAAKSLERNGPAPRKVRAVGMALFLGAIFLEINAFEYQSPLNNQPLLNLAIASIVGLLAYQLILRYSKLPLSNEDDLDLRLAKYEPINIDAYRILQGKTRRAMSLKPEFVFDWLKEEVSAVEQIPKSQNVNGFRFINKNF